MSKSYTKILIGLVFFFSWVNGEWYYSRYLYIYGLADKEFYCRDIKKILNFMNTQNFGAKFISYT